MPDRGPGAHPLGQQANRRFKRREILLLVIVILAACAWQSWMLAKNRIPTSGDMDVVEWLHHPNYQLHHPGTTKGITFIEGFGFEAFPYFQEAFEDPELRAGPKDFFRWLFRRPPRKRPAPFMRRARAALDRCGWVQCSATSNDQESANHLTIWCRSPGADSDIGTKHLRPLVSAEVDERRTCKRFWTDDFKITRALHSRNRSELDPPNSLIRYRPAGQAPFSNGCKSNFEGSMTTCLIRWRFHV